MKITSEEQRSLQAQATDRYILELSLKAVTDQLNNLVADCTDATGKPHCLVGVVRASIRLNIKFEGKKMEDFNLQDAAGTFNRGFPTATRDWDNTVKHTLVYAGFYGSVEWEEETSTYHGKITHTEDDGGYTSFTPLASYESGTLEGLREAFQEAVNDLICLTN